MAALTVRAMMCRDARVRVRIGRGDTPMSTHRPARSLARTSLSTLLLAGIGIGVGVGPHLPAHAAPAVPLFPYYGDSENSANALGGAYVRAVDRMLEQSPSGSKSARENAYSALIAVWIAACTSGAGNVVGATAVGAGVGAGLGGIAGAAVGAAFAGIGALPGATSGAGAGGMAGAGAGLVVGTNVTSAEFIGLAIVTSIVVDHIESKYPQTAALDLGGDRGGPQTVFGYLPQSANTRVWASAMASPYAGPAESMFIHLVDAAFTDQMLQIADKWTGLPGLSAAQRGELARLDALRPMFAKIAYIKRNKRVSGSAKPAIPLAQWATTAVGVVRGDSGAVRAAWLGALGLTELGLSVDKGKLRIKTGRSLRDFGAPAQIELDLPDLGASVSVGPARASISLEAGNFTAGVGAPDIVTSGSDAGKIRVKFSLDKGSTIAVGTASFEAPGAKGSVSVDLRTNRSLDGEVLFEITGRRVRVSKVSVSNLSVDVGVGSLPGPARELAARIQSAVSGEAQKVFAAASYTSAFETAVDKATKSLIASIHDDELFEITDVESLTIEGGKPKLTLRGKKVAWPIALAFDAGRKALVDAQKPGAGTSVMPMSKPTLGPGIAKPVK